MDIEPVNQISPAEIAEVINKLPMYAKLALELVSNSDNDLLPRVRCFYLSGNRCFFGILLSEISDSYIVGGLCKLTSSGEDGVYSAEKLPISPVSRLHKTSCEITTIPLKHFLLSYLRFLYRDGEDILPEYFTEQRKQAIKDFLDGFGTESNNLKKMYKQSKQDYNGEVNGEDSFYVEPDPILSYRH